MIFNSVLFGVFLIIVFAFFWLNSKSIRNQNAIILIASYFFYGCWDYRFLSLIFFSTITDFIIGMRIADSSSKDARKIFLFLSIFINLGFLVTLKYFNFFLDNFNLLFSNLGIQFTSFSLEVVLPVGISFYTFQTMSYSIDVYRGKCDPTRNFFAFASFVSFFPQLVAGPIERASNLLPQFEKRKTFSLENSINGLRQILWGLVKKVLIADNCAYYSNMLFESDSNYEGLTLVFGVIMFSFQIYGDFSGYSDIAIGTSRLFGFNLKKNFSFPYFSRSVSEFWRNWHISLSSWFRDYLYIPLGGSKMSQLISIRNVFIIFLVSGFWHGASWTFIFWGGFHAILFLPSLLLGRNRKYLNPVGYETTIQGVLNLLLILKTFLLVSMAWVFFRAENLTHAFSYFENMFVGLINYSAYIEFLNFFAWKVDHVIMLLIFLFLVVEWLGRKRKYAIEFIFSKSKFLRYSSYLLILILIFWFGGEREEFIYFQF